MTDPFAPQAQPAAPAPADGSEAEKTPQKPTKRKQQARKVGGKAKHGGAQPLDSAAPEPPEVTALRKGTE